MSDEGGRGSRAGRPAGAPPPAARLQRVPQASTPVEPVGPPMAFGGTKRSESPEALLPMPGAAAPPAELATESAPPLRARTSTKKTRMEVIPAPSPAPSPQAPPTAAHQAEAFIAQELEELSIWARANIADARNDMLRFWVLKGPAIACAAATAALEALHWGTAVIVVGLTSAICTAVDGAYPGGLLHNAHKEAIHDIRKLQHEIRNRFQEAQLKNEAVTTAAELLKYARTERARIIGYLKLAEASLGKTRTAANAG